MCRSQELIASESVRGDSVARISDAPLVLAVVNDFGSGLGSRLSGMTEILATAGA